MAPTKASPPPHRLVVVGGGVGGLDIATRLARRRLSDRAIEVTLIDRETAYVWKPMLHTIAAGTSDAGTQETVFAAQARHRGFRYELGEAMAVCRRARHVVIGPLCVDGDVIVPERIVGYDTLVLSVGSRANDFGTPGVAEHCLTIDCRSDARRFNDRLRIELVRSVAQGRPLTVAVVGGGATGVELAAELIAAAAIAETYGVPDAASHLRVALIEAGPRLLAPFPDEVASAARAKLEALGVDIRTDARVASVEAGRLNLRDATSVEAGLIVWAAGVMTPPLMATFDDLERTKNGRLVVGPTLCVADDPSIFALGDCASPRLPGRDAPVPTTAQAASQQARYLSRHLPALIEGHAVPPATYQDFGALVSLGGYDAYGTLARFGLFGGGFIRGRVAQFGHAMLYRGYQTRLHGPLRGSLLWLTETLTHRVRAKARLN